MKKIIFTLFLGFVLGSPIQTFAQFDLSGGVTFNATVGNPMNVTAQDGVPESMTFSPDGTRMYFIGNTNDRVYQYNLSTAFDITTAVYNNFVAVGTQDATPRGVAFSADGTRMFMSGNVNVYQYNLSTPFQVNTATYSGTSFATTAAAGRGVTFSPTGNRMFFTNTGTNSVLQYNLSTPYNISTASYIGLFSFATQDTSPQSTYFSPDGLRMFMVGDNTDRVYQYNLTTAFELSTATYAGFSALISGQETSPTDAVFSADGLRMYVIGDIGKEINQYNLTIYYSRQTGNWNDTNTWSSTCEGVAGIGVPPAGANVVICNGHTVTLTANATCNNLTVNAGGTLNLGAFTFTANGATVVNGILRDPDLNTGNFTFGAITVGTTGDFGTSGGSTSAYTFRGNIVNNKRFITNGGNYTFATNNLTIQDNATFPDQTVFGSSASLGSVDVNVTVLESSSHVTFRGAGTGGLNIATGRVLRNENTVWGTHTNIDELEGLGTFINAPDAVLFYGGANAPMPSGTFNITAANNTVAYSGTDQNVKAGTYQKLWLLGNTGNIKTLEGNITVSADNLWINYATLDVSASNYSVDLKHSVIATNGGSINPRAGTVSLTGNIDVIGNDSGATSTLNFYNLVVNKTSAVNQVKINNPIQVTNTLTLTSGELVLRNGNITLTNAVPANQILPTTPSSNSYIVTENNRSLVRQNLVAASYIFPVGNATQYQPITITNPNATASVRFGTPTATVPTSGVGSWFVSNGSATSTVRFNNPQGGTLLTNISAVGKYNAGAWTAMSGTTYPTATDYSVSNVFTGSTVEFGILTSNSFRTTWVTTDNQIIFPSGNANTYNITWRNLTTLVTGSAVGVSGNHTILGLINGDTYQIDVTGNFSWFYMNNNATERTKIKTIEQWGNIAWASIERAFHGCSALTYNATDVPNLTAVTDARNMFNGASSMVGDASMGSWNVSNIQFMDYMFANATVFNANISAWNVGNVRSFEAMFLEADAFNQPIGSWSLGTTANINMYNMFFGANVFNQPLNTWNVQRVTNMNDMFRGTVAFNQPLNSWNTSSVTNMAGMFLGSAFNQPIGSWNTSAVTNMAQMFNNNAVFNQDLSAWNTANVTNVTWMFFNATAFNQSLASWNVANVAAGQAASMLDACGMNTANYDATLIGWAPQAVKTGVVLGANGRTYCTAFGARATLTSKGWTIPSDALSGSCPSFSAVTATNVTTTSFTANWTAGTAPYTLDVSTDVNFGIGFFVTGYNNLNVGNVGTYNVTVPSAGVYYYRVKHTSNTVISNTKMVSTFLPAGSGSLIGFGTVGNKVEITDNTVYNFTNTNTFTLSAWIKINALGTDMHIISKWNGTQGYALWVTSVGKLAVFRNATSSATGASTLPTNTWTHVAVVFSSGGGFRTYINGVLEATVGGATITGTTEKFTIGSRPDNSLPFNGQIDEVRIWNITRTIDEICASMCSKLVGNESGLVGYFRFDENASFRTENKAYGMHFDGINPVSSFRPVSSAPLGDVSANTYGGTSVTLTNTDVMTANNFTGSPAGVHLYKVNATPNATGAPVGYNTMYTDRYWGVFLVGGSLPTVNLAYNYSTNTNVNIENALRFAKRDNNADNTWATDGGATNDSGNTLFAPRQTSGEYILCERNSTTPDVRNGGMVVNFTGSNGITIPNPVSNDFTIEFWMRSSQASTGTTHWYNGARLVSSTLASTGAQNDYGVSVLNGRLAFGIGNTTVVSTTSVNTGAWFHVAVSRQISGSNSILTIVLNGGKEVVTSNTSTNVNPLTASTNLTLGNRNNTNFYFTGEFDELRFWDMVLPMVTVGNWMNLRANQSHSNAQNLVAYYRFDENIGVSSENLTTGTDATMTSSAMWVASTQPLADGAFHRLTVNTASQIAIFTNAGITVNFGATVPNGEVIATRLDVVPNNFPAVAGMSFMKNYWVIRNYGTNQTFSLLPEIKFEVPTGNVISATDLANPNNIKLYKRPDNSVNAGDWVGVARATGFGSIRFGEGPTGGGTTTVGEFSQFVIGSVSSPLPIDLLGLKGERVSSGQWNELTEEVRLEWATSSEINNKGFEVEMSADGLAYQKIAFVEGKGNSTTIQAYSHTTIQPHDAYYRLRQIDFDGTFAYSPVVFVEALEAGKLRVYPNPAKEKITIVLSEVKSTEILQAIVFDNNGKQVWKKAGKLEELQNTLNQQFKTWKAGVYMLQIQTNKRSLQTKIVKE